MEELRVPTRQIHVEVVISTGAHVQGSLFVHESPYYSCNSEYVVHLLNDERTFLPLAVDEHPAAPFIVNKSHIVRVRLPLPAQERSEQTEHAAIDHADCTLHLADGDSVKGTLSLDTPETSSRVVDKLNLAESFVPVVTDEGIDFVRKSHVVHAS